MKGKHAHRRRFSYIFLGNAVPWPKEIRLVLGKDSLFDLLYLVIYSLQLSSHLNKLLRSLLLFAFLLSQATLKPR